MDFIFFIPAAIFGVLIGNYATSLLFRLPRGIDICGISKDINQPPCCSVCGHLLKWYEALPVISWITARFKCNYCGAKVNPQYLLLESSVMLCSIILCYLLGYSEEYLLLLLLFTVSILSGLIYMNHEKMMKSSLTVFTFVIGALYRTLSDVSILPFIQEVSIALIFLFSLLNSDRFNRSPYKSELTHITIQLSVWASFNPTLYILTYGTFLLCIFLIPRLSYLLSMLALVINVLIFL